MKPLISVIIPCYNQGHFLKETFESLILQDYKTWEAIIVDDGSTDDTAEISKLIIDQDTRFKYVLKSNGGLSSARNEGLKHIEGNWVQFLDSDDLLQPTKFSDSLNAVHNHDIVITNFLRLKSKSKKIKKAFCDLSIQEFSYESILLNWDINFSIPIHCALFKREIIENIYFDEELKAKEDWFFWLQVFKKDPKSIFLNKNLALYRIHEDNMTKNAPMMDENLDLAYQKIYNSLSEDYKIKFFNRVIDELAAAKSNHLEFKDGVFYRKIFYYFKSLFKS